MFLANCFQKATKDRLRRRWPQQLDLRDPQGPSLREVQVLPSSFYPLLRGYIGPRRPRKSGSRGIWVRRRVAVHKRYQEGAW